MQYKKTDSQISCKIIRPHKTGLIGLPAPVEPPLMTAISLEESAIYPRHDG